MTDYPDTQELWHFNGQENQIIPAQSPPVFRQVSEVVVQGDALPPVTVKLVVDAAPGCGGVAWPAGRTWRSFSNRSQSRVQVLASHLLKRKSLENLTVVELGSGTGLVGIVAGLLNAEKVWITDQEPLLELMNLNISLNGLDSRVTASVLNWGAKFPADIPNTPDLVLAADCVYYEPAFPLLVDTLSSLATSPKTEILFCYKKRRKADKRFFAMLRKVFTWTIVEDSPSSEEYARESIFLYRLVKKTSRVTMKSSIYTT